MTYCAHLISSLQSCRRKSEDFLLDFIWSSFVWRLSIELVDQLTNLWECWQNFGWTVYPGIDCQLWSRLQYYQWSVAVMASFHQPLTIKMILLNLSRITRSSARPPLYIDGMFKTWRLSFIGIESPKVSRFWVAPPVYVYFLGDCSIN